MFTGSAPVKNFIEYYKGEKSYLQQTAEDNPLTLKKLLTRVKFTLTEKRFWVSKCEDPRCGTCAYFQTGQTISFKNSTVFEVN